MSIELRSLISILSIEGITAVIFIVAIVKAVQRLRKAKRNQEIQDGFGCEKITATLEGYKTEHHGKGSVHLHPVYAYDNNGEKATLVSVLTKPVVSQDKIGKKVTLYRNITTGEVSEDAAVEMKVAQVLLVGSIFAFFMTQLFMLPFLLLNFF